MKVIEYGIGDIVRPKEIPFSKWKWEVDEISGDYLLLKRKDNTTTIKQTRYATLHKDKITLIRRTKRYNELSRLFKPEC